MKKRAICGLFLLIVGLFFLSACVPKCPEGQVFVDGTCTDIKVTDDYEKTEEKTEEKEPEIKVEEKEEVKEEPKVEETTEEIEEPEKTEKETEKSSNEILNNLKEVYKFKVKGYEFYFGDKHYLVYKLSDDSVGDLIKIRLDNADYLQDFKNNNFDKGLVYYDVVYVDLNEKKVTAFCEGTSVKAILATCIEEDLLDVPMNISWELYNDKYKVKLPSEILYSLFNENITVVRADEKKYTLKNRAATLIETEDKIFYFDPLLGLPVKIEYSEEGMPRVTVFDNLISNKIKLEEMKHRSRSDIASEETFY